MHCHAMFSKLMDIMLTGLKWEICLANLDNIIVFGKTRADHLARLHQIFSECTMLG